MMSINIEEKENALNSFKQNPRKLKDYYKSSTACRRRNKTPLAKMNSAYPFTYKNYASLMYKNHSYHLFPSQDIKVKIKHTYLKKLT